MKIRLMVGGLLLSLGGWASYLYADDALKTTPFATLARPQVSTTPPVVLLQPKPLKPEGRQPAMLPGSILRTGYPVPSGELVVPPPPGGLPVDDPLPTWSDTEDITEQKPSDFGADRIAPVPAHTQSLSSWTRQGAQPGARPAVQPLAPAVGLGAPIAPPVVPVQHQPDPQPLAPPSTWLPPPAPLPEGLAGVQHDFWAPAAGIDPDRQPFYVGAEYLYWWTKADHVPALVTTSDPSNVNPNGRFGFLGQAGTTTLFGGDGINGGGTSGARITAGLWLDNCEEEGLEISGFVLGRQSTHFDAGSADFPVLARPFFNLNANTEFSELVAFPGLATGRVSVDSGSQLWGIEGNLRCNVCCLCDQRLDVFGGFRYLDLQESITIREDIQGLASAPEPFTNQRAEVFDRFATHNSFYGGQLGANYEYRMGRWFADVKGKLGIGVTDSAVTINGAQTFFNADGSVRSTTPGGLLALNSNIGTAHKDQFSFVPEVGLNLGYQVNDNLRVFAGYTFLYWTGVMRPGDQIDRNLDVTRIPNFPVAATPLTQVQPSVPFHTTDYWAHGINIGIEFRY